ncbi:cytochrome P450 [Polyplosphaeria fusca]|uniref:Cytochrome P450 n=1 Tax=Polyplosphaeria fusca TaxID=682080 RepID=A0A9P4QZD6_9PLEO|nr:cytochrome P450 [Polyplosphaeria fusca]
MEYLSTTTLLYGLPLSLTVYTVLWILYCRTLHPLARVPGPFWASITRVWYIYRIYRGDGELVERALHRKYGPLIRIAPNEVSSSDPAAVPEIYRNHNPLQKTDFYSVWSSGNTFSEQSDLFTCLDENEHKEKRKTITTVYSLSNVVKNEENIQQCTLLLLQKLEKLAKRRQPFDIGEWLHWYAFDVIGKLTFGSMFGFLEREEDHHSFIGALDALLPITAISGTAPTYYRPVLMSAAFSIPSIRRGLAGMVNDTLALIAQRKDQLAAGNAVPHDLLQQMLDLAHEKGEKINFSDKEASLHSWANMVAGSDTTAIALKACVYYLSRNPTCQSKLHAEVEAANATISSPIKYTESLRLPYLCACIKEAMRLFPSVAMSLPRMSPREGLELSGFHVPAGYRVGVNAAVVQYDEGVYGADTERFVPERWLVEDKKVKEMERAFLTFGAGTRTCSGKNISLVQIYTAVPEIVRKFVVVAETEREWTTYNTWFNKQSDMGVGLRVR